MLYDIYAQSWRITGATPLSQLSLNMAGCNYTALKSANTATQRVLLLAQV